uniref:Geranylgeranyl transferase type-2 subunit alpha n=1 Tax=Angiostrongylus cantonensis TaxID=6313 RepID=A0A0K0DAA9_ANGCA
MHFVKKVPTTDEERAVKEKERAIKLKTFCAVRDRIFEKRAKGELDDEILTLTQKLLEKNPDVYTFWNIRRETINKKIKDLRELEVKSKGSTKVEDLLRAELFLTQLCLEANHKSYSAWFHRGWVLQQQEHPGVKTELMLCDKALKLDCRNFHTWDHRRVVAKLCSLGWSDELEFCNRLIDQNFSNYSAWHYRAALHLMVGTTNKNFKGLDEITINDELKKVTSAFFTDPDDQSAWMYTRFLLEMDSKRPKSLVPCVPLTVSFHGNNTTVVMSKTCTIDEVLAFVSTSEEAPWKGISALSPEPDSARIWQCMSSVPCIVRPEIGKNVTVDITEQPYANRVCPKCQIFVVFFYQISTFSLFFWVRYVYVFCLLEIDPVTHHEEILSLLEMLATELDVSRREIYKTMASRQILNQILTTQLSVRGAQLTSLDGVELLAGLVTTLDVSENHLRNLDEVLMPNLQYLTANENPIVRLVPNITLCNVKFLALGACHINDVDCVLPALKRMCALERFLYCETPLVSKTEDLAKELPSIRLIPHYL